MSPSKPKTDGAAPAEDAIARHREELKKRFPLPSPVKKPQPRSLTSLSVLVAVLALTGGLVWLDPSYQSQQFSSAVGKQEVIQLADGSRVTLDAASRTTVSWHLRTRRVELLAGQAFFSVAPATYRPFLTRAGSTQIKVVGTRYNVNRLRNDVLVTVEEGKVEVQGNAAGMHLGAGDQVLVRSGQLGERQQIDTAAAAAWTKGRLVFDRTPLHEVLAVVQRYRPTRVVLHDRSLAELPVSGAFDSARLDGLLALLPKILPVELNTDASGTLHLQRRAAKK